MKLRMQLIRAAIAIAVLGGVAAAETSAPAPEPECPLARISHPQRILLLDPTHKRPVWIDARIDTPARKPHGGATA